MIAPELLPLQALPAGSAMGNASNWLFNYLVNTLWPLIDAGLNNYSFCLFAGINFAGFIFMSLAMSETAGKDIDRRDSLENSGADDLEVTPVGSFTNEKIEKVDM